MSTRKLLAISALIMTAARVWSADAPRLHLRSGEVDTTVGAADLRAGEHQDYYIVQFRGPVEAAWKQNLQALGVSLLDYIPDFAFLARMTPGAAEATRSLDSVRWVGPYPVDCRVSPELVGMRGPTAVTILIFPGESTASVEAEIGRVGGGVHSSSGRGQVEATIPAAAARRIAACKGVAWIEPRVERKLSNNVALGLMAVPSVWSSPGLFGSGEIVGVCDTGLDTGDMATISADFAGRVLKTYDLGRKKKWNDPDGHGTHVAGSVAGSGVLSGSDPASHSYLDSFAGAAPEARLVFQSVLDNAGKLSGIPSDLNDLFGPAHRDGCRIHTNSWGAAVSGVYNIDSRNTDMFTWNNKDLVVLFAAGNEGTDANSDGVVDPDSINSPGTAKNCITVGGSENYRLSGGYQGTYGGYWPSDYPANPIKSDRVSNNPSGIAAFSGRGPTNDGRLKPDLVAPGTNIISARSHAPGAGSLWGQYDANYNYSGGTSMSTPLTAGSAALIRQYYRTLRGHAPSAALVKATLINGATELYPGQYGTGSFVEIPNTRPNNVEGWGLANPAYSITPPTGLSMQFVDNTQGLTTGGSAVYQYDVAGGAQPVRVTLVWTDYPGSTIASKALVNDLDLTVALPGGSILRGNATTDRTNNVEGVDIASPTAGTYTITVGAYNVPQGPQPFALVVSAPIAQPLSASISSPADDTALFAEVTVTGTAAGTGFQHYVLEYGAGTSPGEWLPIGSPQSTQVIDDVLGTWDTQPLPDGAYTLRLTVTGDSGSAADQATVNVTRTSIADLKANPDDTAATLTGKLVSAGPAEFAGTLYVQEPNRTSGIRVNLGAARVSAPVGSIVTVTGTLQTQDGERVISNPTVTVTGRPTP